MLQQGLVLASSSLGSNTIVAGMPLLQVSWRDQDAEGGGVVGMAKVDLSLLPFLGQISGWYNLLDDRLALLLSACPSSKPTNLSISHIHIKSGLILPPT